jgi:UDP-glucuronate decarboxylase
MKTILITGGAGFIGSNLCEKLIDSNKIICMDNLITGSLSNIEPFRSHPNFTFINADITEVYSLAQLEYKKIDEIYHLASIASPDKYKKYSLETLNVNVIGTINVLNLCKFHKCKLLFTSTSEIYGDPLVHPQQEEYFGNVNAIGERSCYDEGKRVSETYLYEYKKRYNLDVKIVRLFNTYGPKMDISDGRVVTNFIECILNKTPVKIYGSGNQTRSFCYIDDTVRALMLMMSSDEFGPINIGNPNHELTILDLKTAFEMIIGEPLDTVYLEKTQDDPMVRKPDISRAQGRLGWSPEIPLLDGLRKTLGYFYALPRFIAPTSPLHLSADSL